MTTPQTVYTALLKVDDGWREVGTPGDFAHARQEMRDWVASCPREVIALGSRVIPPWSVRELDPNCGCMTCDPPQRTGGFLFSRMYVCPTCGDKRCPGAGDHTQHGALPTHFVIQPPNDQTAGKDPSNKAEEGKE